MRFEQLTKKYALFPKEEKTYIADGAKYTVTRHFTGDTDIDRAVAEYASNRTNREYGLYDR